jgi:hypothetical protein
VDSQIRDPGTPAQAAKAVVHRRDPLAVLGRSAKSNTAPFLILFLLLCANSPGLCAAKVGDRLLRKQIVNAAVITSLHLVADRPSHRVP